MITFLLIVLIVLLIFAPRSVPPERQSTVWTILIILLVIWILFATGAVGDYGYWRRVP